jgi:hypothetical protein
MGVGIRRCMLLYRRCALSLFTICRRLSLFDNLQNVSTNECVIILLSLTSTSSIRIASRRCLRNSCASCWRKSKYWSYFRPRDAKTSLASSHEQCLCYIGPTLTWGSSSSLSVPFAWSKRVPRGSQTDLQWLTPQSKYVHRVLLDHGHLSTQVIAGTPLG